MVAAELEVFHSRPIAPTRRLALGDSHLPLEPRPGAGAILLAGIVASTVGALDSDDLEEVAALLIALERGQRTAQPRLRHRLQQDRIGLTRSRHRLVDVHGVLRYELDLGRGAPAQHLLGALYAAGALRARDRPGAFDAIRTGMAWRGVVGPLLIARLGGQPTSSLDAARDPIAWALQVLDLEVRASGGPQKPDRGEIQRRYRDLLIEAHPDHGGEGEGAAARIAELREARRILMR